MRHSSSRTALLWVLWSTSLLGCEHEPTRCSRYRPDYEAVARGDHVWAYDDRMCEAQAWCSRVIGTCIDYDEQSPPALRFAGVRPAGLDPDWSTQDILRQSDKFAFFETVEASSLLLLRARNDGDGFAPDVRALVEAPACTGLASEYELGAMNGTSFAAIKLRLDEPDCAQDVEVAIELNSRGWRGKRARFTILATR